MSRTHVSRIPVEHIQYLQVIEGNFDRHVKDSREVPKTGSFRQSRRLEMSVTRMIRLLTR